MPLNVYAIGASRNIGYFAAIRLLDAGATITFLFRSASTDETIKKFAEEGKAHVVKGDALIENDVRLGWEKALEHGPVDFVLFTVGGTPKFHLLRGAVITPENLVTQCLLNVLCTMPSDHSKLVAISSTGLTKTSHASLPLPLKPLYGYLLAVPHKDKVGAERVITHCAGWQWDPNEKEPGEDIMGPKWMERSGLPEAGSMAKNVLVIRPALLTDGKCLADAEQSKKTYRVSEQELGGWTVSRKDVAHFVADAILNRWDEFSGKTVNISY